MTWDVDAESTAAIMKDVGVSLLASDDKTTDRRRTIASTQSAAASVQSRVNYSLLIWMYCSILQ